MVSTLPRAARQWLAGFGLVALSCLATAAEPPSAAVLEATLAGDWAGALAYRDYQSGRRFELPMRTRIEALGDGATLIRVAAFDDGPRTGTVFITTVSLFDGAQATSTTIRKGREVESWRHGARVSDYRDAEHWTLVFEHRGSDDNRPADIRITQTRDGNALLALKEVRPDGAADYVFRNETRLRREPPR